MAQTLEDFLISIKYGIDEPSQTKFFDALKRAATSVAGIAGQLVGLGVAVLTLAENMSEAGSKLYWMSQRTGESVGNIQAMSYALTDLGLSGEHATQAMTQLYGWVNSRGPAATAYLRSLGITATDTAEQLHQLGKRLLESGPRGSTAYAIEMNRMRGMGLDEETLRRMGGPGYDKAVQTAGVVGRAVWGAGNEKTGPERFAKQADEVLSQFGKMGLIFTNVRDRFALGLFDKILPELEKLNERLIKALPQIQGFLDQMIAGAPALLHFLEKAIWGFGHLLEYGTLLIKTFKDLPDVVKMAAAAFVLIPKAFDLMRSPLFMVLAGLVVLMEYLDDYQHWQKDQETHSQVKHSRWDWSGFEKMKKGFEDSPLINNAVVQKLIGWNEELAKYVDNLLKIPGAFHAIEIAMGLLLARSGVRAILGLGGSLLRRGASAAGRGAGRLAARGAGAAFTGLADASTAIAEAVTSALLENAALAAMASAAVPAIIAAGAITILLAAVYGLLKKALPWLFGDRPTELARPPQYDKNGNVIPGTEQPTPNTSRGGDHPSEHHPRQQGNVRGGGRRISYLSGGVQLASAGDDWASSLPSGFGEEDKNRLYDMLKLNLEAVVEKLSDIFDTVMALAIKAGADVRHVGGGGATGDGNMDVPDLAGMTEQERNTLGLIRKYESGGKNIMNSVGAGLGVDPRAARGYTAQGYYQMLNSNWARIAPLYGIKAPNAMAATDEEQTQVALHLLRHGGIGNWSNFNPGLQDALRRGEHATTRVPSPGGALRHQPLGTGGGGMDGGGGGFGGRGPSFSVHNNTSIAVTAPNPGSAAMQVADHMPRVNEQHIRFAKGALLA